MNWDIGRKLKQGRYLLENKMGEGSFGEVFKALDTANDMQEIVVKIPLEKYKGRPNYPELVKRLQKEADELSKFNHPHITKLIDTFEEDDILCVVTAYIPGKTLYEIVQTNKALPYEQAIAYISEIGSALSYMHQQKKVHRDVHPSNIMIDKDDNAILIDFGLTTNIAIVTNTYYHFGHDNFAPYEQRQGSAESTVDIYALAATLYYAVTGELPALASDRKDKPKEIFLVPPSRINSEIPPWLETAILKGMEIEAHDRPANMRQWLAMITPPPEAPTKTPSKAFSPSQKTISPISSQTKTQAVFSVITHTLPYGNPQKLKEIPWGWVVWNSTLYAGLGIAIAALAIPRFLVAGAHFLAIAWALSIVGDWAMPWAAFLTVVWLVAVLVVIGAVLASIQSWFGIAWSVFILVLAAISLTTANPNLKAAYRLFMTAWNRTKTNLLDSFNKPHSFWILVATNLGGLMLGQFLYKFFR